MGGWDQLRARLIGTGSTPMIYCFSTCRDSIRTIPVLQHDPNRAEDLDTNSEDHAADDWRYAAMSRPWLRSKEEKKERKYAYQPRKKIFRMIRGKRCEDTSWLCLRLSHIVESWDIQSGPGLPSVSDDLTIGDLEYCPENVLWDRILQIG